MEDNVRPKVRPTTYEAKRYVLQNHILTKLGDIPLSDLTEAQICRFLDERKRFGSHRPESVEYPGLSEVTMIGFKMQQTFRRSTPSYDTLLAELFFCCRNCASSVEKIRRRLWYDPFVRK